MPSSTYSTSDWRCNAMRALNTNDHRIYVDGQRVGSGDTFNANADALEREGVLDADSAEGKAWAEAHGAGAAPAELDPAAGPDLSHRLSLAGRAAATARLRDRLDPATETTVKGTGEARLNNQPSAGGPAEVTRDDVTDPNAPPPISPAGESGAVSTGAPGSDTLADERSLSAPAVLGDPAGIDPDTGAEAEPFNEAELAEGVTDPADVGESGSHGDDDPDTPASQVGVPEYAEGVKFASAQAENKADELVAAGELDAADLKPGKGKGADGAFKVGDVEAAAA